MFWLPSTARRSIQGDQFGNGLLDTCSVTVLPVIFSVLALGALVIWRPAGSKRYPIFWLMLLGIWMLGPLCIMFANTTPTHGGFTVPGTGWVVLLGAVTVVPVTLFMSLMSGDLFVLALVTVLFNLLALADLMGYRVTISQNGITWEKGSVRSNDTTLL